MVIIILFISDLDNTLIHSYKRAAPDDICVEYKEKKALSYMTPYAYSLLDRLNSMDNILFTPLTTRSTEQYERIHFFDDRVPKLALSANGGILYENGVRNREWFEESKKLILNCHEEFEKGIDYFKDDEYICFDVRTVDELFVFTKSTAPLTTKVVLESILDTDKVSVYNIGEKIYIFPNILTKGNAVSRLKKKYQFDRIICAGDSEFDVSMLNKADCALCPNLIKESVTAERCIAFDTENQNFAEQLLEYIINNFK